MNTESKAGHAALGATERSAAHDFNSSKARLMDDLKILKTDAETMLREAADSSAEGFAKLRARFEGKLADAKARLARAKSAVGATTRTAANATQTYVKENPWQSAGILIAVAVIAGFCLGQQAAGPAADASDD